MKRHFRFKEYMFYYRITSLKSLGLMLGILVFFTPKVELKAQDFISDFKKINLKYKNESYVLKMSYNYYNELNNSKPDQIQYAEVRKGKNKYYLKLHGMETIISNGVFLQANHDFKSLILDTARAAYSSSIGIPLDSLEGLYQGVKYTKIDSTTASYSIPSMGKGISHTDIQFNPRTYEINQIEIFFYDMRKGAKKGTLRNKLRINYTEVDFTPLFNEESFSHSKYLYKTSNTYKVKKAYQKYSLVNNL